MKLANLPIILGLGVLTIATPTAIFLSARKDSIVLRSQAGKEKTAVLYAWPVEAETNLGGTAQVKILLATEGQETRGASVKVSYDPTALSLTSIDNGVAYGSYTEKVLGSSTGVAAISAQGSFTGTGSVATLNFLARQRGSFKIRVLLESSKVEDGEGNNILRGVDEGTIIIN